jgi:CHAT domain
MHLRDTGSPDLAIGILQEILIESTAVPERIGVLRSLASCYVALGQFERAIPVLEQARTLATEAVPAEMPVLDALRASMLVAVRRDGEAIGALEELDLSGTSDPVAQLAEAQAWMLLLAHGVVVLPETRRAALFDRLAALAQEAEARGDATIQLTALSLAALVGEVLGEEDAADRWQRLREVGERYGRPPDAMELLGLARFAYRKGDSATGRAHLARVPAALAAWLGGVADIGSALDGPSRLRLMLDHLVRTMLDMDTVQWEDVRLVNELRRDALGRARGIRRGGQDSSAATLTEGVTDEVLSILAPASGTTAVIEWLDYGQGIGCLLTAVRARGAVETVWLEAPDVYIPGLAERLRTRLANWHMKRVGDPLDFEPWRQLEQWLRERLAAVLSDGDHVVFIEHELLAGLPWHAAVGGAEAWTSSYASGWTELLTLVRRPPPARPARLAVALVPRFRESAEVLGALTESAARTDSYAASNGLTCVTVTGAACDHAALRELIGRCDVVKLLCHGFVDPENAEVGLMLTHAGALPPAHAVATAGAFGRAHRLSWRDCQHFPAAPRAVFSAACSSGVVLLAGLGERLGLFGALRHAGTGALVAPKWDIVASQVLPILDDAMERNTSDGRSLAQALSDACRQAEASRPRWLAWPWLWKEIGGEPIVRGLLIWAASRHRYRSAGSPVLLGRADRRPLAARDVPGAGAGGGRSRRGRSSAPPPGAGLRPAGGCLPRSAVLGMGGLCGSPTGPERSRAGQGEAADRRGRDPGDRRDVWDVPAHDRGREAIRDGGETNTGRRPGRAEAHRVLRTSWSPVGGGEGAARGWISERSGVAAAGRRLR